MKEIPLFRSLISSDLLDNDWYKFTMQFALFVHGYSDYQVGYRLKDRKGRISDFLGSSTDDDRAAIITALNSVLLQYTCLEFEAENVDYVKEELLKVVLPGAAHLLDAYSERLTQKRTVRISCEWDHAMSDLVLNYAGGWFDTILLEVPFLALITEFFSKFTTQPIDVDIIAATHSKLDIYNSCNSNVVEFGTRRRFSQHIHFVVHHAIKSYPHRMKNPVYTSNVLLSKQEGTPPRGTCAHEWFMFHEAHFRGPTLSASSVISSIRMALESWLSVYDTIFALSDVYTTRMFFRAYEQLAPHLQKKVHYRCDSGIDMEYTNSVADALRAVALPTDTHLAEKMVMFSNSLNPEKVATLQKVFHDASEGNTAKGGTAACKSVSYGIGTNFTNDLQQQSWDIVIKLDWVASNRDTRAFAFKLSDEDSKFVGDESIRRDAVACVAEILASTF